ncbi:hypothetical protein SELMODRAFT_419167 [Selaginella moellendorffii]|uniref:Uncharacterized protein n=1 Tax=Selaginella moellendorffii TaxID=88036 RepID=D8S825_SELML|nr:hypothetical protein SELMODRAFT_419167 [Selaginella moellendorffii]
MAARAHHWCSLPIQLIPDNVRRGPRCPAGMAGKSPATDGNPAAFGRSSLGFPGGARAPGARIQDDHQNPRQDDQQQQNHEQEPQEISLLLLLVPFVIGAGSVVRINRHHHNLAAFATHEVSPSGKFEVKCSKVSVKFHSQQNNKGNQGSLCFPDLTNVGGFKKNARREKEKEKKNCPQYFVIINMPPPQLSFGDRESFAICVELHVQERKHQDFKHFKLYTNIVFNLKTITTVHSFIDNGARLCTLEALRAIPFWCGPAASVSYTAAACRVQYSVVKTTSWASWIIRQGNWFIRAFKFH